MTKKNWRPVPTSWQHQQQARIRPHRGASRPKKKKDRERGFRRSRQRQDRRRRRQNDVAATKASLEATIAKLQGTIGDLGVQSGLIANTRTISKPSSTKRPSVLRIRPGKTTSQSVFQPWPCNSRDRSQAWQVFAERHRDDKTIGEERQNQNGPSSSIPTRSHAL